MSDINQSTEKLLESQAEVNFKNESQNIAENQIHDHAHDEDHAEKARPAHYPEKVERDNRYWLSIAQWKNDPEFAKIAEQEFISSPLKENDGEDGWARREFLKLMGASIALGATGCIRRPVQKILPYAKQPEEVTLGVANYYTSTMSDGGETFGLLVKTREGRPIRIEGNPNHESNKGAVSARVQASILKLYDPERLQAPKQNLLNKNKTNRDTINISWEALDNAVVEQLKKGGVSVLTGAISSPSKLSAVREFVNSFGARHIEWEPIAHEELAEGAASSYGSAVVADYRFDLAKMIVSVDADFLGAWLKPTQFTKQFAAGRKNIEQMSRLVCFESNYSLTGGNADLRYRIKPSQQIDVVMGLAYEIVVKKGASQFAGNSTVKAALEPFANVAQSLGLEADLFAQIAQDLWDNKGQSLVVAGGLPTLTQSAKQLQIAVNFLNSVLGNDGKTVVADTASGHLRASYKDLSQLIEDMNSKKVKTLIIEGVNPVYALGVGFGFSEALKNVDTVVYIGDRNDETGGMAQYVATASHTLESWGDSESSKNCFTIGQPTIRPMYDTRSMIESLMSWAKLAKKGGMLASAETEYDYVRGVWRSQVHPKVGSGKSFEDFWQEVLQVGYVAKSVSGSSRSFRTEAIAQVKPVKQQGFELVLYPTVGIADGTLANIAWLQELPDPVTKICWDNYLSVSMMTAEKQGLKEGDVVEVQVGQIKLNLPVHIQPGLHDEVLSVAVGFGQTAAGKVANGVGVNAYQLVTSRAGDLPVFSGQVATIKKLNKKYQLACTQDHHSMEGRQIVAEATLKDYLKNKEAGIHRHKVFSIWSSHKYDGHKWGMSIDLNSCTGCSACVTACQSENNIPVVGKRYVMEGREMHWIRIDRYYVGDPKDALMVFQPMMCQHCDNAPCETVCPVLATVHSNEGLNEMVYNRCVGTRYCSNNCPYKVRRFNWFNFRKDESKSEAMAHNPDVTVRVRGVMEKCTFCVQRIKEGKNKAKLENRKLKDGDIKTACQTSCPTDAIVFGDMNDPESKVSKAFKEEPRSYALLEEWHAAPSVRYQSKIRNNGKETVKAEKGGH